MRNYEVTFIVDSVLSGDEIKATAQKYVDQIQSNGCDIVHIDEMGLRQLAYEINKRHSGYYYCVEFQAATGDVIIPLELNMRRDERIMRFLTVKLDKYGVKYNDDKRQGLIGKAKRKKKAEPVEATVAKPVKPAKVAQTGNLPDNLKRIEGIGPKIADVLKSSGVETFAALAAKSVEDLKEILKGAGERFSFQDPTTWPAQAEMAANGEWDKLRKWQDQLKAGRVQEENQSDEEE
jgi:small subunit ribosomal protein S6